MIEVDSESDRAFAYGNDALEILHGRTEIKWSVERTETIAGLCIHTIKMHGHPMPQAALSLLDPGEVACPHGNRIEYASVNRLPQEGWQELIDCWSCHSNEFRSMLDWQIRPRAGGLLTSNFYLIAHEASLPGCCAGRARLFYHELGMRYSARNFIYKFFEEYFQSKNSIVLESKGQRHEIKFFYRCVILERKTAVAAIKIGVRETEKTCCEDAFVGEYYKDKIMEEIADNSIGVETIGYALSFIRFE